MKILYPEIKEDNEKKIKNISFDDTLDGVSEKDLERSLERTKSLKEAAYLENECNEAEEKKKTCCLASCLCKDKSALLKEKCCLRRLPCVEKLLTRITA